MSTFLLKRTFQTLRLKPFHFLLLQIPEASLEILDKVTSSHSANAPVLSFLILFPYFCVASFCSNCLTYASVAQMEEGKVPTLRESIRRILSKFKVIIPVAILGWSVWLLGLAAVILPGIYFLAIYMFLPPLLIADPIAPWSTYFFRSKKLAKKQFGKTVALATAVFLLGLAEMFWGSDFMLERLGLMVTNEWTREILFVFLKLVPFMILGAIVDVLISHYFIKLREVSPT